MLYSPRSLVASWASGSSRLRILQVTSRYWPYAGGAEKHLQEISERLVADGHEVTVFTTDAYDLDLFWQPSARRVSAATQSLNGVRIVRFPVVHLPLPRYSFGGLRYAMTLASRSRVVPASLLAAVSPLAPYVPAFTRELSRTSERFDVVHGMNIVFEGLLWPALKFARRTGARFVATPLIHLGEDDASPVRGYYTMRHQIELLRRSDAVLAETDSEAAFLAGKGCRERVHVIGSGVNVAEIAGGDAARFRQKYGITRPFVYYIGTAAYDKGSVHLIDAMRTLWTSGVDADLVLAGNSLATFETHYDSLPPEIRGRCHRIGAISDDDRRDLIAASDIFAMPSRTDSFGITYLEAWCAGKPVIGADAGGVPDVIADGDDGYIVKFGDVDAIAARILRLLGDDLLRRRMGEAGRQKVLTRYTWDAIYPRVRDQLLG